MLIYFLNDSFSYFAFKSTHFAQVLDNFAQERIKKSLHNLFLRRDAVEVMFKKKSILHLLNEC